MKTLFVFLLCFSTLMANPKVIIFDFGGVMAQFDKKEMIATCVDALGVPAEKFNQALHENVNVLAKGLVDEELFWQQLATKLDRTVPSGWHELYVEGIVKLIKPREKMYQLVQELKAKGHRVALFSDVSQWQAEAFRKLGLYEAFSPVMLSCEMGVRKPERESYQKVLDTLGVNAQDCIFVDDRLENVAAARKIGMQSILFCSTDAICLTLSHI